MGVSGAEQTNTQTVELPVEVTVQEPNTREKVKALWDREIEVDGKSAFEISQAKLLELRKQRVVIVSKTLQIPETDLDIETVDKLLTDSSIKPSEASEEQLSQIQYGEYRTTQRAKLFYLESNRLEASARSQGQTPEQFREQVEAEANAFADEQIQLLDQKRQEMIDQTNNPAEPVTTNSTDSNPVTSVESQTQTAMTPVEARASYQKALERGQVPADSLSAEVLADDAQVVAKVKEIKEQILATNTAKAIEAVAKQLGLPKDSLDPEAFKQVVAIVTERMGDLSEMTSEQIQETIDSMYQTDPEFAQANIDIYRNIIFNQVKQQKFAELKQKLMSETTLPEGRIDDIALQQAEQEAIQYAQGVTSKFDSGIEGDKKPKSKSDLWEYAKMILFQQGLNTILGLDPIGGIINAIKEAAGGR